MRTLSAKKQEVEKNWFLMDADGRVLGRLATQVAAILRGKHKTMFTPHVDTGDHVIVINAEKIRLTGEKLEKKMYHYHTGYPGGLKSTTAGRLISEHPERLIQKAVKGMLPKTKLGNAMYKKLWVYTGGNHPHEAQKPVIRK